MAEFDPDQHRDTVHQAIRDALADWLQRIRDAILNHTTNTVNLANYPDRGTWRSILTEHLAALLARLWQWAYRLRQAALDNTEPDDGFDTTTPTGRADDATRVILDVLADPGGTPTTLRNLIRTDLNKTTGRVTPAQVIARIEALLSIDGPNTRIRDRRTDLEAIIDNPDSTPEQRRRARADLAELETGIRVEDHQWDGFLRRLTHDLIHTARNHADVEAAHTWTETTGEELLKRWLSADDTRVRPDHVALDGNTVPLAEPFTVDGTRLFYPGDPSAPPSARFNCRCTLLYETEDEAEERTTPQPVAEPVQSTV